ncbi:CTP:molybdopterin cytidylyltransferase MocA [Jannaschia faecimaris]|uniref:CTP:molybdopterin cytidylyltransferase MocA n=1 Tax=Jannaschia faecimaris TaxID=1244108 RepID=A0A1H3P6K1_9RHOB|nr:nucleotidyltransferase family protein [Jannaschia faecimaris]SDY95999.1 CTP:molybdopterin cytidylyltransferase MocA [Jannaschia faecimaris]
MRAPPAILILAAGSSSRMRGTDKLLVEIDGTPLILRATRAALGVTGDVILALPPNSDRRAWLGDTAARIVEVPDRAMSASIRAGVAACDAEAVLIHLADMPEIDARALAKLSTAWMEGSAPILRATDADGTAGQPVIFHRDLFPELLALTGDIGARDIIARHDVENCPLPGKAATTDLDTPEAWAAWLAARGA